MKSCFIITFLMIFLVKALIAQNNSTVYGVTWIKMPAFTALNSTVQNLSTQVIPTTTKDSTAPSTSSTHLRTDGKIIPGIADKSSLPGRYDRIHDTVIKGRSFSSSIIQKRTTCHKSVLTGFALMAGSIPYVLKTLKNKYRNGLKLTSQKTITGGSAKACKKVTSITFAISIGR